MVGDNGNLDAVWLYKILYTLPQFLKTFPTVTESKYERD